MTQVWADLNLLLMRTKEKGSLGGPAVWEIPTTSFQFVVKEGNGNPLQCSCLENPRDGGAWWDAVYGVAQSCTRLNRLSSSSSSSKSDLKIVF